jgi:hypothetical protein
MADQSTFRPNLDIFGVPRRDPGWIYIIKSGELLKVGKTKNPKRRIFSEARTWLPDLEVVGIKPFWNVGYIERTLQAGCSQYWHAGEWFLIQDKDDYATIIEGFREFYDQDRDMNSVDFIYWINGSGMAEIVYELRRQNAVNRKQRLPIIRRLA